MMKQIYSKFQRIKSSDNLSLNYNRRYQSNKKKKVKSKPHAVHCLLIRFLIDEKKTKETE